MTETNFVNQMSARFSGSDIDTMMFDLGLDSDDFSGGKTAKIEQLFKHMRQNNRLPALVSYCSEQRNFINWELT